MLEDIFLHFQNLNEVLEADVEKTMVARKEITLVPVKQTMEDELVSTYLRHEGY